MAVDYGSLTVVQIRELFKSRGIPTTGLTKKQQLINRLVEEDANQTQLLDTTEDENLNETTATADQTSSSIPPEASAQPPESATTPIQIPPSTSEAKEESTDQRKTDQSLTASVSGDAAHPDTTIQLLPESSAVDAEAKNILDAKRAEQLIGDSPGSRHASPPLEPSNGNPTGDSTAANEPAENVNQSGNTSTASPPPEENRKRKRRSETPPLSEEEIAQKKAKQDADGERVILKEDLVALPSSVQAKDFQPQGEERKPEGEKDKRFSDFATPSKDVIGSTTSPTLDAATEQEIDERPVIPAIHPATCALYVNHLKRPLRVDMLKAHLESLAHSPRKTMDDSLPESYEQDLEIIINFFLDPIRTHCFVVFSSVSAASRVRSALHNKVWPPEGNREPLWVDFVPEEKVEEWIDQETKAAASHGSRGGGAQRWEVSYQRMDDGSINPTLHDVTAVSSKSSRSTGNSNVQIATSNSQIRPISSTETQRRASGRQEKIDSRPASFLALDTLFKSTQAKPKLYFMPVDKQVAATRLEELDNLTSTTNTIPQGGSGHPDSHRYTFENGRLVDNGPEFGLRSQRRQPRRFRGDR